MSHEPLKELFDRPVEADGLLGDVLAEPPAPAPGGELAAAMLEVKAAGDDATAADLARVAKGLAAWQKGEVAAPPG